MSKHHPLPPGAGAMFRIGQRIVCVEARVDESALPEWANWRNHWGPLTDGAVYTVRSTRMWRGTLVLCLAEIVNPLHPLHRLEFGYAATRFRPLVEPSIEWARAIDRSVFERPTRRIAA